MLETLLNALVIVATVAAIAICGPRFAAWLDRDGQWNPGDHGKMRRYRNGKWEYRDMTEEEVDDYQNSWP